MRARSIPFSSVPPGPGTYALIMRLATPTDIAIGRLGAFCLPSGWYAYVGSALGPGGLAARLIRHRRRNKRPHWHIDYLVSVSHLTEIWWVASAERWECVWARAFSELPGMTMPVPGFGSSDCRCSAHLLCSASRFSLSALAAHLKGRWALCLTVLGDPI
jgi:Uri superfamily endonuclease